MPRYILGGWYQARATTHDLRGTNKLVIFLDFHSTKQGLSLVDSWSPGLD